MPSTPFYGESTAMPQDTLANLRFWWGPTVDGIEKYRAYKVKVTKVDFRRFGFELVGGPPNAAPVTGLDVDLFNTPHVWPGIPSTAVIAQKEQFGYLFLSDKYMESKGVPNFTAYADGPGKWPFGADKAASLENAVSMNKVASADARNEVLRSVSALLGSLASMSDSNT